MTEIIERLYGYSNESMKEYCERLYSVITAKKEVKKKVGKNIETILVPKYKDDKEILLRVERSIEYYKNNKQVVELRDYQKSIVNQGVKILKEKKFLYLAMEVRTGKTLTSLSIADNVKAEDVLFITKKKAIDSILKDFELLKPSFSICVINYESLHTIDPDMNWDLIICDEAHSMGAFPKPSQRAEMVRDLIRKHRPYVILLSGTPTPESYSQMYHQVCGIPNNPFSEFVNFYRFADKYVNVKQRKINGLLMNDYSRGLETILDRMKPYTINYTQKQAGFVTEIEEEILEVEMDNKTYNLISKLKKDLVVEGKKEVILGDTPVKLMMKLHQLYSGTIKFESGNSMVIDDSKARFIKESFEGSKIAIFYKFKEELAALEQVFGDQLTTEISVFEDTDKNIALQIVSGREGISLKIADYLVYYNIDFSATSYWQSRDRMTTKDRTNNKVYWVFSKDGIEKDIYKAVSKKKDYTINHFKETFLV